MAERCFLVQCTSYITWVCSSKQNCILKRTKLLRCFSRLHQSIGFQPTLTPQNWYICHLLDNHCEYSQVLGVIIALLYSGCVSSPGKGQSSSSSSSGAADADPEALRAGGITLLPPNNSTLVFSAAPANGSGTVWTPAQPGDGDNVHAPLLQDVEQGNGDNRSSGRHSRS